MEVYQGSMSRWGSNVRIKATRGGKPDEPRTKSKYSSFTPAVRFSDVDRTALHLAAEADSPAAVKALLDGGADPTVVDRFDKLPRDHAERRRHQAEPTALLAGPTSRREAAAKKAVEATAKSFLQAVRDGDDEAIRAITRDPPDKREGYWAEQVEALRKEYAGQFSRLPATSGIGVRGGWADVFAGRTAEGSRRYVVLVLRRFPDGQWRIVERENHSEEQATPGRYARRATISRMKVWEVADAQAASPAGFPPTGK